MTAVLTMRVFLDVKLSKLHIKSIVVEQLIGEKFTNSHNVLYYLCCLDTGNNRWCNPDHWKFFLRDKFRGYEKPERSKDLSVSRRL